MTPDEHDEHFDEVRCEFTDCDASMIFRVLLAVVDQAGTVVDADLAMLEALDLPLEDTIDALQDRRIESASVRLDDRRLVLAFDVESADGISDATPLGDKRELVESFFEVEVSEHPPHVSLTAALG